ncbi:hypothetical protein Tsubulata_400585 [Turnera subulata]|uniref:Uncharacterized protein n=1 Tax=Turnera subulata TaxID=218843 RepID=A0A9Q0GKW2_9ROSI|nr:hypothetical protein Tsubulata_400585 [Turnera subulata]
MGTFNPILNFLFPPMAIFLLVLVLPPFLVVKLLGCIKRSIQSENVKGKVVLITGASSGIGECIAYEYASRGARLALTARRQDRLQAVANKARELGSPDVIVICADVSREEDCKRFVNETVEHFGQLDHLVNNAGVPRAGLFEKVANISDLSPVMDINFWGSLYSTHFAIPHLKRSKGKIIVNSSVLGWLSLPGSGIYNASKAALISFYETLSAEFGEDIGITIVTPGFVETEMMQGNRLQSKVPIPFESSEVCAKAMVDSACRGDLYSTEPSWLRICFLFKALCPELVDRCIHWLMISMKHPDLNSPD